MKYDAPKEFKILCTILTGTTGNRTYPKVAVQCSADTFVVNHPPKADSPSTFVV